MDFLLKQRLVGAVVLVALAVIFIPMLLEGPGETLVPELEELPDLVDPGDGRPLDPFPTADMLPVEPGTAVVAADSAAISGPDSAGVPQPDAGAQIEQDAALPEPAAEAAPEAAPEPGPVAEAIAKAPNPQPAPEAPRVDEVTKPLGSWVVQLGSFSSQDKAIALRDKARQNGFTTQVEKVRVNARTYYRVRVGPFLERAEADETRKQLTAKFALDGRVLSYP